MKNKKAVWFFCFIIMLSYHNELRAYSTEVHRKITEKVIDLNMGKLNEHLNSIGLVNGITEQVNKKEVRKWIEDGSYFEDYNWTLLNNPLYSHFYNPLTNMSGVGDIWPSAYAWTNASNNSWSWKVARDKFHEGLTLKTKDEREKALAKAFEALGHMIHLVQDMGVPAHTRGEIHVSEPYESYTKSKLNNLNYTSSLFTGTTTSVLSGAPRQFWDTDKYTLNAPNPGVTTNFDIALAEYK